MVDCLYLSVVGRCGSIEIIFAVDVQYGCYQVTVDGLGGKRAVGKIYKGGIGIGPCNVIALVLLA